MEVMNCKENKLEITAIIDSVGIWRNGNFGIKTMDSELYSTNRDIEKYQALDFQRGDTVSLKYTVNGQWKNIDSVERVISSDESAPSGIPVAGASGIPVKDDLPPSLEPPVDAGFAPPVQSVRSTQQQPTLSGKVDTNERIARSVALKAAVEMVALLDHKGSEEHLGTQLDAWYSKFLEKLTW